MARPNALYREFARLNEVTPPENLEVNELAEALNVVYDGDKAVSKRKGIEVVKNFGEDIKIERLIDYSKKEQLLVAYGKTLAKSDATIIKSDFDNVEFDWEVFSDGKLYLVNGKNYYVYDGTDISEVSPAEGTSIDHIKKCKYIVQRGQRLFAAGDSDNPNSIYFSEVGEANNFPANNVIDAISDDNDVITGLAEFHSAMVAFKKKHVYAWFGWNPEEDVRFDKINVHSGTVSHLTIKRVYSYLFYAGEDGVYVLAGLEPNYISSSNITDDVIKHRFGASAVCAEFYDGMYLLSMGDLVLSYNYARKAWAVWTGWKPSALLNYEGTLYVGADQLYKGSDEYNDNGKPIHFSITTKPFDCNYPIHDKKFSWFYLLVGEDANDNEIEVVVSCDYKNIRLYNGIQLNTIRIPGADLFDEEVPENRTRLFFKKARMLARSSRIQATISNNEVNEGITIYGVGFQFWPIRV